MLNYLKEIQLKCDEVSFSIEGKHYHEIEKVKILKHKCFHLAKLLSKIASVCEQDDHNIEEPLDKIINEVIPDLLVYSLQISNIYDIDLEQKYKERLFFILNKGHQYFESDTKEEIELKQLINKLFENRK